MHLRRVRLLFFYMPLQLNQLLQFTDNPPIKLKLHFSCIVLHFTSSAFTIYKPLLIFGNALVNYTMKLPWES